MLTNSDTIAAISTPPAVGGVSMVRISGGNAIDIAAKIFRPAGKRNISEMAGYTACYGGIYSGGEKLDDGVLLIFRTPHSYTGEDVAEITCHGGILVTRRVLRACLDAGARMAQAGEFTRRAMLNGKLTLTQAEAVADVINAKSDGYLRCVNAQLDGALYRKITAVKELLTDMASELTAWIDYPDEMDEPFDYTEGKQRLKDGISAIKELLDGYGVGQLMKDGISVAIVGKPNAGKSTLMNLLAGCERSIVADIEGTTRDIVEENVILGGVPARIADCAGIRDTNDPIEKIGVEKMRRRIQQSDVIFALFDNSRPLSDEDRALTEEVKGKNVLCIINKQDLQSELDKQFLENSFSHIIEISAKNEDSLKTLDKAARELINPEKLDISAGFIANERQRESAVSAKNAMESALNAMEQDMTPDIVGVTLETALDSLSQLTGESVSEQVIDRVFSRFCVGK